MMPADLWTHREIDAAVLARCRARRLTAQHVPDSRQVTVPGWPDWVIIGPRGVLWREVKTEYDTPTGDQIAVGHLLKAAGQDWALWFASSLLFGVVDMELDAIAARLLSCCAQGENPACQVG